MLKQVEYAVFDFMNKRVNVQAQAEHDAPAAVEGGGAREAAAGAARWPSGAPAEAAVPLAQAVGAGPQAPVEAVALWGFGRLYPSCNGINNFSYLQKKRVVVINKGIEVE